MLYIYIYRTFFQSWRKTSEDLVFDKFLCLIVPRGKDFAFCLSLLAFLSLFLRCKYISIQARHVLFLSCFIVCTLRPLCASLSFHPFRQILGVVAAILLPHLCVYSLLFCQIRYIHLSCNRCNQSCTCAIKYYYYLAEREIFGGFVTCDYRERQSATWCTYFRFTR